MHVSIKICMKKYTARVIARKFLFLQIDRKSGKIGLYESKITRNFFFSNENDREVAKFNDFETKVMMYF